LSISSAAKRKKKLPPKKDGTQILPLVILCTV
jgi:hypothetical protein